MNKLNNFDFDINEAEDDEDKDYETIQIFIY